MSNKSLIAKSLLGAIPGLTLSGIGIGQLAKHHARSMDTAKTDLVDVKKTVKENAPNLIVATSEKDIDKVDATDVERKVMKFVLNHIKDKGNAAFVEKKNLIISAPRINRDMLGHEIGHSIDLPKGRGPWDTLVRTPLERRAWEASPLKGENTRDVSETILGTYRGADKVILGAPAAVAGAFVPIIMRALKRKW